jgi:hypothetical protein
MVTKQTTRRLVLTFLIIINSEQYDITSNNLLNQFSNRLKLFSFTFRSKY